jgi:hypothetical protein
MMKFNILISTVLLVCFSILDGFSQEQYQVAIQEKIDGFTELSNAGEWDKALDYMYPKLFAKVPKEQITGMMRELEGGLTIKTENIKITKTQGPVEDGGETFVRVEYTGDMKVALIPGGMFDSPKAITAIDQQFKAIYGAQHVQWSEKTKEFSIKAIKSMMAIKGADNEWKLIEINMDQIEVMEFLFSPAIMSSLIRQ